MANKVQNLSLAVAVIAAFFCGGCAAFKPTALEQEQSFKPHDELSVEGESIRNYALLRTAGVYSGKGLELQEFQNNPLSADGTTTTSTVEFKLGANYLGEGSAAAVDRRGYFVTAAHCIEVDGVEGDVYLVFSRSKALEVLKKARVVWSGRGPSGDGLDFAVLKIASPLRYVFDWGPMPEADDPVLGVGSSNDPDSVASSLMAPFGGKVLATYDRQKSGDRGMLLQHDSPLRKGNSGGPLFNREGQLLGVNYAGCWSIQTLLRRKKRCGYAARPDIEWLSELIEQDYAALSGKKGRIR